MPGVFRGQPPATLNDIARVDAAEAADTLLTYLNQHGCPITERKHLPPAGEGIVRFTAGSKAMVLMPWGVYQNSLTTEMRDVMHEYTNEHRGLAPTSPTQRQRHPSRESLRGSVDGSRRLGLAPSSSTLSGSSSSSSIQSPPASPTVHTTTCAPLGAPFAVLRDDNDDDDDSTSETSSSSSSASPRAAVVRYHYYP